MTPTQLKAILPHCRDVTYWLRELEAIQPYGVTSPLRMAAFIAQVGHESAHLSRLVESLSYNVRGLRQTWPSRFPDDASAAPFARNPIRLANYVYANRLGNGPPESGDGWKYRGRGLIQVTGKANYEKTGEALGLPLLSRPDLLESPGHAVRSAGWFWQSHGLNELADTGTYESFEAITRRINGGLTGLEDRTALWHKAREVLHV